jgi:hypothetical protein
MIYNAADRPLMRPNRRPRGTRTTPNSSTGGRTPSKDETTRCERFRTLDQGSNFLRVCAGKKIGSLTNSRVTTAHLQVAFLQKRFNIRQCAPIVVRQHTLCHNAIVHHIISAIFLSLGIALTKCRNRSILRT